MGLLDNGPRLIKPPSSNCADKAANVNVEWAGRGRGGEGIAVRTPRFGDRGVRRITQDLFVEGAERVSERQHAERNALHPCHAGCLHYPPPVPTMAWTPRRRLFPARWPFAPRLPASIR